MTAAVRLGVVPDMSSGAMQPSDERKHSPKPSCLGPERCIAG